MSESKACPNCGHSNSVDARFCGRCGTPLPAVAPAPIAPKPAPRPLDANRTMLGALIDPTAVKPAEAAAPPARVNYKTVVGGGFGFDPMTGAPNVEALPPVAPPASSTIGLPASPMSSPGTTIPDEARMPAFVAAPAPVTTAPAPVTTAPAQPANEPPLRAKDAMRTMMGVGLDAAPAAAPIPVATLVAPVPPPADPAPPLGETIVDPPKVTAADPPKAAAAARHRTMLGMPAPMIAAIAAQAAPPADAPAPIAPAPAHVDAAPPKRAIGPSNRTMLGVIAPVGARASAAPAEPVAPAAPVYAPPVARSAEVSSTDVSIAGLPSPRRRVRGWLFAVLALGVLLVASVITAGLYYRMTRNRVEVAAVVAASASGEVLGVDVGRAPDGTRARFGTVVQPLSGTHADFPLAADALHVGDNAVSIDVLFADGTTESHSVTLTVEYRVRADLGTLTATPPAITVVVDAIPGSTVVLDASPLTIDASGHGTRAYPIASLAPDATGMVSLTAHYTITPPAPGAAATGTLSSRVPTTTLRMERPADAAVTDHATVDVAGTTQVGAAVTVEGTAATVAADGHFHASVPLASVGAHELHITATLTGRAPGSATIHVERVADLARAAAEYAVDRTLTYARLAAAPATFQGQHVAIEGRVYNVDLQDGHGVLQMLARDCPAGQRCPLWVTHSAITDITVESWVRVIGSVAGEQQFMSQSGEVRTVPRVDAAFVLPSHP